MSTLKGSFFVFFALLLLFYTNVGAQNCTPSFILEENSKEITLNFQDFKTIMSIPNILMSKSLKINSSSVNNTVEVSIPAGIIISLKNNSKPGDVMLKKDQSTNSTMEPLAISSRFNFSNGGSIIFTFTDKSKFLLKFSGNGIKQLN